MDDGYNLWSNSYDRNLEDVFAIQDEIAQAVVRVLKGKLLGEREAPLVKNHTENLDAYNLYLQGRFFFEKRTEEGLYKALDFFEKAIEKDPRYALAYSGLADTYSMFQGYGLRQSNEVTPKAKAMALKALEIDNTLAEAYASLGWINFFIDWNWLEAEKHFKEAFRLNPNYGNAHLWFGWFLSAMGRFRSEQRVQRSGR